MICADPNACRNAKRDPGGSKKIAVVQYNEKNYFTAVRFSGQGCQTCSDQKLLLKKKAASRSSKPVQRDVHLRQARRARAAHMVKCSLAPGNRELKEGELFEKMEGRIGDEVRVVQEKETNSSQNKGEQQGSR